MTTRQLAKQVRESLQEIEFARVTRDNAHIASLGIAGTIKPRQLHKVVTEAPFAVVMPRDTTPAILASNWSHLDYYSVELAPTLRRLGYNCQIGYLNGRAAIRIWRRRQ